MNLLTGVITEDKPVVRASVKEGKLFFSKWGDLEFVVDTGFTSDLLIPPQLVQQLDLEFLSYETFHLATDQIVTLPAYRGNIVVGKIILEVEMTPGDALIGMSLMQTLGSQLIVDFRKQRATLKS